MQKNDDINEFLRGFVLNKVNLKGQGIVFFSLPQEGSPGHIKTYFSFSLINVLSVIKILLFCNSL